MAVLFLSEHEQASLIKGTGIPLVPRNRNTGWPLLQASSGHYGNPSFQCNAFSLAALLARLPGFDNAGSYGYQRTGHTLDSSFSPAQALDYSSNGFCFRNNTHHILITVQPPAKKLTINIPGLNTKPLEDALNKPKIEMIATLKKTGIIRNPAWLNETTLIHKEVFVDLGAFLDSLQSPEIKAYFEKRFKVNAFNLILTGKAAKLNNLTGAEQVFGASDIGLLKESTKYNYSHIVEFLTALEELAKQKPTKEIVACFQKLLTQLNDPKKPLTKEKVANAFYQLDKKLTQSLSPYLIGAICGAILGIMGLISGGILGAVATSWGGGFGAFAAAVAGSVAGVKAGMAIGSAVGGLTGFSIGFFNRQKQLIAKTQDTQCDALKHAKETMLDLVTSDRPRM
ncbi:MAG: hypothetical protein WC785_07665 [Tatlockia sp.]|jgi:hypothetical protein